MRWGRRRTATHPSATARTPRTEPSGPGFVVEEYDRLLLLRQFSDELLGPADIADLTRALEADAGGAADAADTVTVVAGADEASAAALWPRLGALLDTLRGDGVGTVRLAMSGAGDDRPDRPAVAARIADAWEIDVIAPDGTVLGVPGGGLFVHAAASAAVPAGRERGWWRFTPGAPPTPLGPRQPAPAWQPAPGSLPSRTRNGCVVEQIPAGVLIRPGDARAPRPGDLCYAVPVDRHGPLVVLGVPDGEDVVTDDVADVVAALPAAARTALRFAPGGRRDVLRVGQGAAELVDAEVVVYSGLPLLAESGARDRGAVRSMAVAADGTPSWQPFVDSVICAPGAAQPRLLRWSPPLPGPGDARRGVVRLSDRWQVTATRAGLWISGTDAEPPALAARPVDARGPDIEVGRPGETLDRSLWPVLERLLAALPPGVPARARLHVHGVAVDGGRELRRLAGRFHLRSLRFAAFGRPAEGDAGPAEAPSPEPSPSRTATTAQAPAPAAPVRPDAPAPTRPHGPSNGPRTTGSPTAPAPAEPGSPATAAGATPGHGVPPRRSEEATAPERARRLPAASVLSELRAQEAESRTQKTDTETAAGAGSGPDGASPASAAQGPSAAAAAEAGAAGGRGAAAGRPTGAAGAEPPRTPVSAAPASTAAEPEPAAKPDRTPRPPTPEELAPAPTEPAPAPTEPASAPPEAAPAPTAERTRPSAAPGTPADPPAAGAGQDAPGEEPPLPGPPSRPTLTSTAPRAAAQPPPPAGRPSTPPPDEGAAPTPPSRTPAPAQVPAPPARPLPPVPFLPGHQSTQAERAAFRALADPVWDRQAAVVTRTFTRMPALRGQEQEAARADLIALLLYLRTPDGPLGHRELDRCLRTGDRRLLPYAACVASALRRLPSFRGAVLRGAGPETHRPPAPGAVLREPAPVSALPGDDRGPSPASARYAIWSVTGRRVRQLSDAAGPTAPHDEVVFAPGTAFRVLEVRTEGPAPLVLLRELPVDPAAALLDHAEPDDRDRAVLARLDETLAQRPSGTAAFDWPDRCAGPLGPADR